jgi:hypothetical protein
MTMKRAFRLIYGFHGVWLGGHAALLGAPCEDEHSDVPVDGQATSSQRCERGVMRWRSGGGCWHEMNPPPA